MQKTQNATQFDNYGNPIASPTDVPVDEEIPADQIWMTWPTVAGFSFATKKWGEYIVSNLRPIVFDKNAYDRLVLPPHDKDLVRSLVEQNKIKKKRFTDIISGKGEGRIFLLHGPPGCGKTLTAEAVSESLQSPLYSVTVGELGTTPTELESKLAEILEIASIWSATILLDEADIFLEQRTESDIVRNAMVGIFLRLLEYQQGVLFLTTNKVKCFDEAFHSRINVAIRYPPLDREKRKKVWQNFSVFANTSGIDFDYLSKFEINGRQIRTCVQLSQALADETNQPLQMIHLKRAVLVTTEFSSNWDNQDPIKVEIQKEIDEELEKIQKKKLEDKKNEELKKRRN